MHKYTPYIAKEQMIKSLSFIDSEYSNLTVAGRQVRDYAIEFIEKRKLVAIDEKAVINVLLRTDVIGLMDEDILEIAKMQKEFPLCVNYEDEAIMVMTKDEIPQSDDMLTEFNKIASHAHQYEVDLEDIRLVSDMHSLAEFNIDIQIKLSEQAMENDVQLIDPSCIFLSYDTEFGENVIIEPNVHIGPGVKLADNVTIRAFSHIEGAVIKSGSVIGPFARIRGKTEIGENAKIGNFVEVKNSTFKSGAKAGHLSYIGDSEIGKYVNIGAGVVTCNYDGKEKHKTYIGDNAFIGTNSSLVAPIKIGNNCLVGAGSFINRDVPDDSFAQGRSKQQVRDRK